MARDKKKVTFYLDQDLLRAARVRAARSDRGDSEIVEDALRAFLGFDVLDRVWTRSDLGEDEAMRLAVAQQHALREQKRAAHRGGLPRLRLPGLRANRRQLHGPRVWTGSLPRHLRGTDAGHRPSEPSTLRALLAPRRSVRQPGAPPPARGDPRRGFDRGVVTTRASPPARLGRQD